MDSPLLPAVGAFARQTHLRVVGFVDRHRRAAIGVAALAMLAVARLGCSGTGYVEPSSKTERAAWVLSPMERDGPTVRMEIDQSSGWSRLTDSRASGRQLFVHDGTVILKADLAAVGIPDRHYLSYPVDALFPSPIVLSPAQIAPSLDRGPRECTFPSPVEDAYVKFFFSSEPLDLSTPYTICGTTSYLNGSGRSLIHADEQVIQAVDHPAPDDIVAADQLGTFGEILLEQLRMQFAAQR